MIWAYELPKKKLLSIIIHKSTKDCIYSIGEEELDMDVFASKDWDKGTVSWC